MPGVFVYKQNAAFYIYKQMLQFSQDDTSAILILTLTENVSINEPVYIFDFTHVLTKDVVTFSKTEASDESNYRSRYNQFTINPSVVFADQQPGEWHYVIYESADGTTRGNVLEYGKLMIDRATPFSFTKYEGVTTYKTYNG